MTTTNSADTPSPRPPRTEEDATAPPADGAAASPDRTSPPREASSAGPAVSSSSPPEPSCSAPDDGPPPVDADALRAVVDEIRTAFPAPPPETELVLMDVDPHRLHAYWTVSPRDLEDGRARLGPATADAPMVMRLYDVSPDGAGTAPHPPFDVDIQGLQSRRYVDLWQAGRRYVAELGLRDSGGGLVTLARSQPVDLPRHGPSPDTTFRSLPVGVPGRDFPTFGAPGLDPAAWTLPVAGSHSEPGFHTEPGRPADPLPVYGPAGIPETGFVAAATEDRSPSAPAGAAPAGSPDEPGLVPVFPTVPDEDLRDFAGRVAGSERRLRDSAPNRNDAQSLRTALGAPPLPPPPPPSAGPGRGPAAATPPAPGADGGSATPLESVLVSSSFGVGGEHVNLEMNAELHIYGRTKPDSHLSLFGRPVAVRPDGTFSVRRQLPDGALVVPLMLAGGGRDN